MLLMQKYGKYQKSAAHIAGKDKRKALFVPLAAKFARKKEPKEKLNHEPPLMLLNSSYRKEP